MPRLQLLAPAAALAVLPAVTACSHRGDLDRLGFQFSGLVNSYSEFRSGDRLLTETRICPEIVEIVIDEDNSEWLDEDQAASYRTMFDETVSGPGVLTADGCITLEDPGEVTWELTLDGEGEPFERFRFNAVESNPNTQLGFDRWQMRWIRRLVTEGEDYELVGLDEGRTVDELLIAPDTPRYVYAETVDVPMLRLDDDAGRIFYTAETLSFELEGDGVETVEPVPSEDEFEVGERLRGGEVALRFEPGGSGRVRTTLPNGEVRESPEMVAVGLDAAASLDVMYVDNSSYLFADVRHADGAPISAAPVTWEVIEGSLALEPGDLTNEGRTAEYALFDPRCEAPPQDGPETRRATVRARLGQLEDTVVIEWIAEPPEDDGPPWEPLENCQFADPEPDVDAGCACSSQPHTPAGPSLLTLGLLALLRRRRHSCARRATVPTRP